jgi:hypothetical protein
MKSSGGRWPGATLFGLVIVSVALAGCSQHEGMPTIETNAATDQRLPFDATSDKGGISPTGSLMPAAIPAGTSLAVHLKTPLSSATSRSGDAFEAVLEEPIIVLGQTIAPRGAILAGKVLEARASGPSEDAGYMRLALTGISINGEVIAIQTSSIFLKRGSHEKRNATVISGVSSGQGSISLASTGSVGANRKAALLGASTSAAYATENMDVGVASDRRLSFRLARSLPVPSL